MVNHWNIYIYILVGGDWNHGMDYDFPEAVGNRINPTDDVIFSEGVKPPTSIYIYIYIFVIYIYIYIMYPILCTLYTIVNPIIYYIFETNPQLTNDTFADDTHANCLACCPYL